MALHPHHCGMGSLMMKGHLLKCQLYQNFYSQRVHRFLLKELMLWGILITMVWICTYRPYTIYLIFLEQRLHINKVFI